MKKITLIFVAIVLSFQVVAQSRPVMHAIFFADTEDKSIGKGEAVSMVKFSDMLSTICNAIGYKYLPDEFSGRYCRSFELKNWLSEFECDTSDIVVFCYLGHGTRSSEDTSVFPQMCLGESNQAYFVPLVNVSKSLAQHQARLTLVIGDCCNVTGEYVMPKETIIAPAARTNVHSATISLMKDLFLNTTGVITMCATKPGTYGWSNQETGSYFLNALVQAIENTPITTIKKGKPWESIMDIVMKDLLYKEFWLSSNPSKKYKMTPCYRIEPRFDKRQPPEGEGGGRGHNREPGREVKLQQAISNVANVNISEVTRRNYMQDLLKEFAPKAIVRTVSADGKIAFNLPYTAEKYLTKIIYSKDIINVNIKNIQRNSSGEITLLEVHEIYAE